MTPNPCSGILLFLNGLENDTTLPALLCGRDGGGTGKVLRSTLVFGGVIRTGTGGRLGDSSGSLAGFRPIALPAEEDPAMDFRAWVMLSLRVRNAETDFLREVCPISGDGLPMMGLLRCEIVSLHGGRAVTPMGG